MTSRYDILLDAAKTALASIAPDRLVTRTYLPFALHKQSDLVRGVFTILPGRIGPYPYEVSDNQGITDDMRATQCARLRFAVIGQLLLPESVTGEEIDHAEFELLSELERLADEAIELDTLMALKLLSALPSGQVEKPNAWIHTEWEVFPLN